MELFNSQNIESYKRMPVNGFAHHQFFSLSNYGTDAVHISGFHESAHDPGEQSRHLLGPAGQFVVLKVIAHGAERAAERRARDCQKRQTPGQKFSADMKDMEH